MKKKFIVANWKSNFTTKETLAWIEGFKINDLELMSKEIIICPPFILLPLLKSLIVNHKSNLKLGVQNISPFDEGPYTGEISAKEIKEFADYVIIGHSERRKNFSESNEMVNLKIDQAFKNELTPIICVSSLDQVKELKIDDNLNFMIAYEPLFAIGSGNPDTPENADSMAKKIKAILKNAVLLYGGSVTFDNINDFSKMPNIDGVLVGKASLDAKEFYAIIQKT